MPSRDRPKVPKSCHERALGLLAVRPRARGELKTRLRAAGFDPVEVEDVLGRLQRVGLIDDLAFARQLAEHQFGSKLSGRRAVTGALLAKGVSRDIAEAVVQEADRDEDDRAQELARSRAARMTGLDRPRAYGRLTSLLMRRGYSPEVARSAARRALDVSGLEE